jgi:hypothetical protein
MEDGFSCPNLAISSANRPLSSITMMGRIWRTLCNTSLLAIEPPLISTATEGWPAESCAGYLAHPFPNETGFPLACLQGDPPFPACFPGSGSRQEGHGCPDPDGFSVCSPRAIRLVSRPDRPSPALLLCVSEAVFPCAGSSTFTIHPCTRKKPPHASLAQRWYR